MAKMSPKRGLVRLATGAGLAGALVAGAAIASPAVAGAVVAGADLSVAISHSPATGKTGDTFTFTLTVANAGPDAAEDVAVGLTSGYRLQSEVLPEACTRDFEGGSVICELGDLASGAEASVVVPLRAYGSGVYLISAVAASSTPDPDTADLVAQDQLLVRKGPLQSERYIAGIYPMILQRSVDAGSLAYWSERWRSETNRYPRQPEKIPLGIMSSDEYRRLRIREAYQRILGRAADASALTYWVGRARGGLSFDAIERNLLASREFASKHGGARLEATLAALFGRPATAAEVDEWTAFTGGKGDAATWNRLLSTLQRSTPARDRVIIDRHQRTLGADPTPLQRYVWHVRYRQGATTERIWAELLVSWDVLQDYPYTDDDYGELIEFDLTSGAPALADAVRAAAS
jgi:hypothetical protein